MSAQPVDRDPQMHSLCLLAALSALSGIFSQSLTVSQPKSKSVTEADSMSLECTYNTSKGVTSIGVYKWYFNGSSSNMTEVEVSNSSSPFMERVFKKDPSIFTSQQRADIEIRNVGYNDTGTYVCEVEIFMLTNGKARGNGTRLLVLEAPKEGLGSPGLRSNWIAFYSAAGAVFLLLAAVVLTAFLRTRKSASKSKQELKRDSMEGAHLDQIQYATLSIKEGKREPWSHTKPDRVVYSKIRTSAKPGDSGSPSENPDSILDTRVSIVGNVEAAHCRCETLVNEAYDKRPLTA
ncbi:natural cytotoxicity triggering receptor 3-like isoform X1 [Ambystoma mexicanum]|uniref:natural cytotoxicity triggering receptor 3-like isoform X1 n=1 Tax=Ambystoma mexicanum TaxID=8296 RepID=UPI0037E7559F